MTGETHAGRGASGWIARHIRFVLGGAWVILVAIAAVALIDSHNQSRADLEERIRFRADTAARFVDSYVTDFFGQELRVAERQLSGEKVSRADFNAVVKLFGSEAAVVLDSNGDLLHLAPSDPALIGSNYSREYAHLGAATDGTAAVSNVVPSVVRGTPIVAFAIPFETSSGRRVLSAAFDVRSTPLAPYLRRAAAVAPNRIYLVDAEGATIATNDPGAPLPEAAGDVASEYHTEEGDYVATQAVPGTPWSVVLAAPEANLYLPIAGIGRWIPWLLWIGFAAGGFLCVMLAGRLLDGRRELERKRVELERANEELGRFAGIASHDLSNPLRTISGFASLLQRNKSAQLDERARDQLDRIVGGAARMQSLIDDLLSYAKSGRADVDREPVALDDVVEEVLLDLEHDVGERSARVDVAELPGVDGDRGQLKQLMQNLISNALKFGSAEGPVVAISAEPTADGYVLAVTDNGDGVPADERESIFDPFNRAGRTADQPGTGLGLAICARIVERHGGEISCEPNQPSGTRFIFSLPVPKHPPVVAA